MKPIPSLEALGLTRLEALAYAYLVSNPASTGYRVSKGIGKPTANVYRALEGLERKGAVRSDRASPPLFRPVPPEELLEQLEREFQDRREIAARTLASLAVATGPEEDGFRAIRSNDEAMGRLRVMLAAARDMVIVDAPAGIVAGLTDAVGDTRSRGVRVVLLIRGGRDAPDEDTVVDSRAAAHSIVRVAVDAREALVGRMTPGDHGAIDGMWTRGRILARALHDAIASEIFFVRVQQGLREGLSVEELEGAFERCRALRAYGE